MGSISQDFTSAAYAESQDAADLLAHFRSQFHIPTHTDLKRPTLAISPDEKPSKESTYLCGNSLGVQPKRTSDLITAFLTAWRTKGVTGHFTDHSDSPVPSFVDLDDHVAKLAALIVGALESEVAVMGNLTANLHLLMASFYRPSKKGEGRWKIMMEGKAFPSDHFAVESQVQHHGFKPEEAMILLEPKETKEPLLKTEDILRKIDEHASETALILLPGIQYYTGQYFDIAKITAHAHSHGIMIGWDCAHAAGNVELKLHEWDVDFAAWCNYKYLNSGPGSMAGIFVHERFGNVDMNSSGEKYWPRLTGWWGDDKSQRFAMANKFVPRPGAAGFQVSNPSALDLTAVIASFQIFNEASMSSLRSKSLKLTGYLEQLLDDMASKSETQDFTIITPRSADERGAQLSVRLAPGLLDPVFAYLDKHGVILDERKPDVIRVAPAPLYNSYKDVWTFCQIFKEALEEARHRGTNGHA